VEEFERYVAASDASWTRSPLLVATTFLRVEDPEAARTSIELEKAPEGGDEATATVTVDGLLDDSVRAVRTVMTLERRGDGTWRVRSARQERRCQRGRGHQDFGTEPCA
jgi:hypothetical protein